MTDLVVDLASLPEDIREKLAELDLELSEGNCHYLIVKITNKRLAIALLTKYFCQLKRTHWAMKLSPIDCIPNVIRCSSMSIVSYKQ